MIDRILDEKLRHALKERALPGFYWGITAGGTLFAIVLMITARGTKGFEVLVLVFSGLVLIGLVLGALVTYLWRELRSSSQQPDLESVRTWKIVPAIFGILGILSAVLLNWFLNGNANQKDLVTTAVVVLIFCLNFGLVGCGLGSLSWLGVVYVRNRDWTLPKPPVWRPVARSAAPFGGPSRSNRLWVLVKIGLAIVVLFLLGLVGMWLTTPYTPTKPNSAGATPVPATATSPQPVQGSSTATPVPPTATSAPTVPPVPAPPTGAPIEQPTTEAATPTVVKSPTVVQASRTATVQKPTATKTPVPCSYTTKTASTDTWQTIAQKLGVAAGTLMGVPANKGKNPAEANVTFTSSLTPPACR